MATGGPPPAVTGRSLVSPTSPTSGLVAPPEVEPTSPRGSGEEGVPRYNGRRIKGKCKWFDVAKGFGFITPMTPVLRPDDVLATSLLGSASEGGSGPDSEPESVLTGASGPRSDMGSGTGSGTEGSTEGGERASSDDGSGSNDIFVHQSVICMPGFRSLAEDEEVEVEYKITDKGLEATFVSGPGGESCKGSNRRPKSRRHPGRKIRCYNCGDFTKHIASKCPFGPLPKRCHNCKSEDHLIADCPSRDKSESREGSASGRASSSGGKTPSPTPATTAEGHHEARKMNGAKSFDSPKSEDSGGSGGSCPK